LEVQEKEKPTPPPPAVIKPPVVQPTSTTTTNNNVNNNNNNNNNNNTAGLNSMEEMFKAMMGGGGGQDPFKNLFSEEALKAAAEGGEGGGDMESLTADIQRFTSQLNSLLADETFDESKLQEFASAFNIPTDLSNIDNTNNTNNNNNNNTTQQQQPQPQQPAQGISIDNFQDHISATLKNLATNASTKPEDGGIPAGLEEIFSQLSKVLDESNLGDGDGDEINNFFEGTMQYLGKNYPEWIERNKDKYSVQDIERFTKQAELFKVLLDNPDSDEHNESLFTKLSEYGSLPEAFTDEYLSTLEKDQEQLQQSTTTTTTTTTTTSNTGNTQEDKSTTENK